MTILFDTATSADGTTIAFERTGDGAATRIVMCTVLPTKELRDEAVEKYHAIEGGQQTLSSLVACRTDLARKGVEG